MNVGITLAVSKRTFSILAPPFYSHIVFEQRYISRELVELPQFEEQEMKPNKVYSLEVPSAFQADQEENQRKTFFKKPFAENLKKSRASYDVGLTTSNIVLDKILLENNCPHSKWFLLYAILGPLACFLMDYGAFVLWPMKNAFLHPETWSILYNVQIDKTFNCQ